MGCTIDPNDVAPYIAPGDPLPPTLLSLEQLLANGEKTSGDTPLYPLDALSGNSPAAFALPTSPLPFTLPTLGPSQLSLLATGGRVQEQSRMGKSGKGYVVFDVDAPPRAVWDVLLNFNGYPEAIPT